MLHTVGILEMKVSDNPEDVIITHSLGSCIGLSLYDPEPRIGGLVHCMLPLSEIDPERARQYPCMFVDTGIPLLIQGMLGMGAEKARLIAKAAGAASLLDAAKLFCIGERNLAALRSTLQ
ncbi:MAG TPA: chemotaxis protein CheD, partial [Candidatus Hydrogenedentes bacterium]|nr:chemotaxis protein CheD [Candidatus Hydrogenedentota bacterium]